MQVRNGSSREFSRRLFFKTEWSGSLLHCNLVMVMLMMAMVMMSMKNRHGYGECNDGEEEEAFVAIDDRSP